MKHLFIVFTLFFTSCSTVSKPATKTSDFCVLLDDKINFYRCETSEVVCYGQNCFPKPAPKPTETPKPIEGKKK